jgi:FtsP/CotA-like multicopper oxidase with cupredoxin domain
MSDAKDLKTDLNRRTFLRTGAAALAGLGVGSAGLLSGCDRGSDAAKGAPAAPGAPSGGGAPVRAFDLAAGRVEAEVGPGQVWRTWGYGGQYPGPEIRLKEGERLRVVARNDLPGEAGTTVHWHGIPVPNPMDGVPGVTQEPIPAGESMTYEYEATPAGTYMYHSHRALQLDRGLVGPLIIEERTPHVQYDREHVVILDDFLPGPPRTLDALAGGGGGREDGGRMMGGMMNGQSSDAPGQQQGGGMTEGEGCPMMGGDGSSSGGGGMQGGGMMSGMGGIVPPYEGLTINGKLPGDPAAFDVKEGERVRFRLINLSSATTYHLALAGHRMRVSHADARPVEPVEVDSLLIGMGERYDVIVEADNPGAHTLMARTVEGNAPPARATVRYQGSRQNQPPEGEVPEGLGGGRRLRYADLQSVETPLGQAPGSAGPDRTFDLRLSGGMMMSRGEWAIDGQRYPDADELPLEKGEHVRVNMRNMSMMNHPMHLHGHFFRVGNAVKDTVLVEARMGRASFDFLADNPGDWFFHCHNLYHLHAGMARVFTYG